MASLAKKNHRRVFWITIAIVTITSLSSVAVVATGTNSRNFSWSDILWSDAISLIFIGIMAWAVRVRGETRFSQYISVFSLLIITTAMRCAANDAPETHVLSYLPLVISVFYFDFRLVLAVGIAALGLDMALINIYPTLRPQGTLGSTLGIRYITFLMTIIGTAVGALATQQLMNMAVEREAKAKELADELRNIGNQLFNGAHEMAGTADRVLSASHANQQAFEQIEQAVIHVREQTTQQSEGMIGSAEILNQITNAMHHVGDTVTNMSNLSATFIKLVEQGKRLMEDQRNQVQITGRANEEVSNAINLLSTQSQEISEIVDAISGIAQQTSLLALNAAIEAARAGESGRGFAVVADEVRKLAEEADNAAQNISRIISEVQKNTQLTVNKVLESSQAFGKQEQLVFASSELFAQVGDESKAIDAAVQDITAVVEEVVASVEEAAGSVQAVSSSSQQLAATAEEVQAITTQQISQLAEVTSSLTELQNMAKELRDMASRLAER